MIGTKQFAEFNSKVETMRGAKNPTPIKYLRKFKVANLT